MQRSLNPEKDLRSILLQVEKPGRYVGGEFTPVKHSTDGILHVALCFPDVYEIGMSNLAIRILYGLLNKIDGVVCERVFAPAPDFEHELRAGNIPLYTLESGRVLRDFDIIGFSIGYELAFTNVLSILDLGNIPIRCNERSSKDPIVLGGGPAVTNPTPYQDFVDAIMIGEGEQVLPGLFSDLIRLKGRGAKRDDILQRIVDEPSFWIPNKKRTVIRSIWNGFASSSPDLLHFPIQNIKTIQDHGVIEIMRGCPNGCRFCHAGMIYRPYREKPLSLINSEVANWVENLGFREITLSSLSSGDYSRIHELLLQLNNRYCNSAVSFSFPSLRIDSFSLSFLSELSAVRKSGLTFAVEAADPVSRVCLNKDVNIEKIITILNNAKTHGWKLAKFYFMIGLPVLDQTREIDDIVDFVTTIQQETRLQLNINIGTFVPKPHTPYQWSSQLSIETSEKRLKQIKSQLKSRKIKVSYHDPFLSFLEGSISRGDKRIGEVVADAFNNGARFDAWEEHINRKAWYTAFEKCAWDIYGNVYRERDVQEALPWDSIDIGVNTRFLLEEYKKSRQAVKTDACRPQCLHPCGVCKEHGEVTKAPADELQRIIPNRVEPDQYKKEKNRYKMLFSFEKKGKAQFLSHLDTLTVFERTFQRAGIDVNFTQGFNPKPKFEFAQPLTLGVESEHEIAAAEVLFCKEADTDSILERLNRVLPSGFVIRTYTLVSPIVDTKTQKKQPSLMSTFGGSKYYLEVLCANEVCIEDVLSCIRDATKDTITIDVDERTDRSIKITVPFNGKKSSNIISLLSNYISRYLGDESVFKHFYLRRVKTLAKDTEGNLCDYFTLYRPSILF